MNLTELYGELFQYNHSQTICTGTLHQNEFICLLEDCCLLQSLPQFGGLYIKYLQLMCYFFSSLNFLKLAEVFSRDGMSFSTTCENLLPRPWIIDDLDTLKMRWSKKSWKKASVVWLKKYTIRIKPFMSSDIFLSKGSVIIIFFFMAGSHIC